MNAGEIISFRPSVAGPTQNLALALADLAAPDMSSLPDRDDIDGVDALGEPARAVTDGVFVTPGWLRRPCDASSAR